MGGQPSKEMPVATVLQRDNSHAIDDFLQKWQITPFDLLRPLTEEHISSLLIEQGKSEEACDGSVDNHKLEVQQSSLVGDTPLHAAAELENTQILQAMVKAVLAHRTTLQEEMAVGEDLEMPEINWDVRDANGLSPLSRAVRRQNVAAIQLLIDIGADPFQPYCTSGSLGNERWAQTYLRYAAWHGKTKVLDALLTVKDLSTVWGVDGKRALHLAIENGQLGVVEVLLQQDLDKYCDEKCELTQEYTVHARALSIDRFIVRAMDSNFTHDNSSTSSERTRTPRRVSRGTQFEIPAQETTPQQLLAILRGALQTEIPAPEATSAEIPPSSEEDNSLSISQQNSRDRGSSLLHLAATYGHTHILEYLLDHQAFSDSFTALNEFGKALIFMAVRHGHSNCLKILKARGVSLKATDIENWSIIHEAVKYRHIDILNFIIHNGGDANCDGDDGWTPLHVAARFGVSTAVAPLIAAGADINAKTEDNETALQLTVMQNNSKKMLSELLRYNPGIDSFKQVPSSPERVLLERRYFSMLTILLEHLNKRAAREGDSQVSINRVLRDSKTLPHRCLTGNATAAVKHLMQMGADDTIQNGSGETPLYFAARKDMHDMVKVLLENNANPNARHRDGTLPLHVACNFGNYKTVQLLLAQGSDTESKVPDGASNSGFTPLMLAARRGHAPCVEILAQYGASLDTQKEDGYTALHLAALNGLISALAALMRAGADTEVAESNGFLPLHVAVRNQQFDATAALLSSGADAAARGPAGLLSLHFASYVCDARSVWLLLQCGVSVAAVDENGAAALHYAARQMRGQSCIQLLLTTGADVNVQDRDGESALHCAAQAGLVLNVRVLLKRGADPDLQNETGLTALHTAVAQGSEAVVGMLLRFGADGRLKDLNGTTPYQLATMARNQSARILIWRALKLTVDDLAPIVKYNVLSPTESPEASPSGSVDGERARVEEGRTICVVCQNVLQFDEEVRTLPCSHIYHGECILGWWEGPLLNDHQTWPLCNASVLPPVLPEAPSSPDSL